ncbi:HlyD family type I secretion periplasmic adaptor subunit [Pararhodobacter zhoushanensis]|uniref:Membrane fusion protein (MFP) family protein n=1 Tax=Pararhodobacter zhoushanensis TaxID=2479545 RepID=A0ABT3GVG6_9RHOB|nr:HlyD family type I secretion periplasmic adaptor subunit [Pararhodobacter zhoushanensis]MCW1931541.1 HlyD family type I secretion periplasmic adaptor subunit [Pararhodobacter zhoushanensis]
MSAAVPELGAGRAIALGGMACLILLVGIFGWAARASISSAVVATGEVDSTPARHPVQHPDGGVVAQLMVREGDAVIAGQLLIRLNGEQVSNELRFIDTQVRELEARLMRLRAERDTGSFPQVPPDRMQDRAFIAALAAQRRLFDARRDTLERQQAQLVQRRRQTEAELAGLTESRVQMDTEQALLNEELQTLRTLRASGLARAEQVSALARSAARLAGSRAAMVARDAELRGQISEIALQTGSLAAARREEAEQAFADTGMQLIELQARRSALRARLEGLDLRAPTAGVVHDLTVPAVEAVVRPAEVVMQIFADSAPPSLMVRVSPDEIDHVVIGQTATLRFPGLAERNLPDLPAVVTNVSAATFVDERTGVRHFRVSLWPTPESMAILADRDLVPGMSVQAFLTTGERTPLAYLISPLREHFARALREP